MPMPEREMQADRAELVRVALSQRLDKKAARLTNAAWLDVNEQPFGTERGAA